MIPGGNFVHIHYACTVVHIEKKTLVQWGFELPPPTSPIDLFVCPWFIIVPLVPVQCGFFFVNSLKMPCFLGRRKMLENRFGVSEQFHLIFECVLVKNDIPAM